MTEEKIESHGPHGHSYVWDAHMKGRERKNRIAGNVHWGRVVHENEKKR